MNELQALLPAAQRRADELLGGPLADLLRLLEGPLQHLDEDLAQLYDDLFIETCAEWVLPYLGDLVAHRPLRGLAARLSSPRADVARTIAYRRRKGTVAVLEQIARDISGFPARAVESWQRLSTPASRCWMRTCVAVRRSPIRWGSLGWCRVGLL